MNLDREVAEKVMGWKITEDGHIDCSLFSEDMKVKYRCYSKLDIPKYSTNITHAMEVEAEMIHRHGFAIRITRLTPHPELDAPNWVVEFLRHVGTESVRVEDYANTLPEAICLAALEALEE